MITEDPVDVTGIDVPTDLRRVLTHDEHTPLLNEVLRERRLSKNQVRKLAKGWPKPIHGPHPAHNPERSIR